MGQPLPGRGARGPAAPRQAGGAVLDRAAAPARVKRKAREKSAVLVYIIYICQTHGLAKGKPTHGNFQLFRVLPLRPGEVHLATSDRGGEVGNLFYYRPMRLGHKWQGVKNRGLAEVSISTSPDNHTASQL